MTVLPDPQRPIGIVREQKITLLVHLLHPVALREVVMRFNGQIGLLTACLALLGAGCGAPPSEAEGASLEQADSRCYGNSPGLIIYGTLSRQVTIPARWPWQDPTVTVEP